MSYTLPYTFVPGTKARAQEVNANFSSILEDFDDLDSKKLNLDLSNISSAGIELIKNNTTTRNIGEIFYTSIPISDAGSHLLDGTVLQADGIYDSFVKYIKTLYNENPNANYFCTETQWQSSVSTYGVCGKFVYNSTNNTVRLPKITGIIEGTTDINALGNLVEAGLPNIKGTVTNVRSQNGGPHGYSGAFYDTGSRGERDQANGGSEPNAIGFNASRSSSLYKDNFNKVQPQTIKCFVYIVIATSSKTDIQVDIDNIATDLNRKADTDLTNVTNTGYIKMAGAGMPSNRYIDLTLGASNTQYTAPANGWFMLRKRSSATGQNIEMKNATTIITSRAFSTDASSVLAVYLPVKQNDNIQVTYTSTNTNDQVFRFIYAVGSESEAN